MTNGFTQNAKHSIKRARKYSNKKLSKVDLIVEAIEADICDRGGIKHEWGSIDPSIIENEIKPTWREIIKQALK